MQYGIDMCSAYEYCSQIIINKKKKHFHALLKIAIDQIELALSEKRFDFRHGMFAYFKGLVGMKSAIYFQLYTPNRNF